MDRRHFLTAATGLALATALPRIGAAQNAVIDGLNAYLNGLTRVRARFRQASPDGTEQTGTFFLLKPGKMRFEFDAPADQLIIADGTTLAVFDAKSNAGPQRYPQRQTPLSLLSMREINVTSSPFVRRIDMVENRAQITLFDPEAPENGQMVMIFDTEPVALREWILTDRTGLETHVFLETIDTEAQFETRIFNIAHNISTFQRNR
tara:strand:+ start:611 stop:1228 length:618 start_codon:yes stop_codon:yes gene_type:complete